MIRWSVTDFSNLSAAQLYEILQLRAEVFVVEQNCAYQDIDGHDLNAIHVLAYDQEQLIGYARILPPQSKYPQISIGRVAVRLSHRGHGLARQLVQCCLDEITKQFPQQPVLAQSQQYLENFYASFGFKAVSETYLDDGIPHVDMIRE